MFTWVGNKVDKIVATVLLVVAIIFGVGWTIRQKYLASVRDELVFVINEGPPQIIKGEEGTKPNIPIHLPKFAWSGGTLSISFGQGIGSAGAGTQPGTSGVPVVQVPAGATAEEIAAAQAAALAAQQAADTQRAADLAASLQKLKDQFTALTGGSPMFSNLSLDNVSQAVGLLASLQAYGDIDAIAWQASLIEVISSRVNAALEIENFGEANVWGQALASLAPARAQQLQEQANAAYDAAFNRAIAARRERARQNVQASRFTVSEIIWWLGDPSTMVSVEVVGAGTWVFGVDEMIPGWLGGGGGKADINDEVRISDGSYTLHLLYRDFPTYFKPEWAQTGVPEYPSDFDPSSWKPGVEIP